MWAGLKSPGASAAPSGICISLQSRRRRSQKPPVRSRTIRSLVSCSTLRLLIAIAASFSGVTEKLVVTCPLTSMKILPFIGISSGLD